MYPGVVPWHCTLMFSPVLYSCTLFPSITIFIWLPLCLTSPYFPAASWSSASRFLYACISLWECFWYHCLLPLGVRKRYHLMEVFDESDCRTITLGLGLYQCTVAIFHWTTLSTYFRRIIDALSFIHWQFRRTDKLLLMTTCMYVHCGDICLLQPKSIVIVDV